MRRKGRRSRNLRHVGDQPPPSPSDGSELSHGSDCTLLSILSTLYQPLCYGVHNVHKVYGVNA